MFFTHGREHVSPYYNRLGILKLENIYILKVSLFTHKLKNDPSNTPAALLNIPQRFIHTRYAANQNFFKPSGHTNYGVSAFKFSAKKFGNVSHQNLNAFHTCSSKSDVKDFYWTLKTDHKLNVVIKINTAQHAGQLLPFILTCISSVTITMSSLISVY